MSWLARFVLATDDPLLKTARDDYAWHQQLWLCFSAQAKAQRDFLFRVDVKDDKVIVWLKSETKPDCPCWCSAQAFMAKEIGDGFLRHPFYAFDLLANPTKTLIARNGDGAINRGADGKRPRGKRVPLRSKKDLEEWIVRKAALSGFKIHPLQRLEIMPPAAHAMMQKERALSLTAVRFKGFLEVCDLELFQLAYQKGIGTAKGLGFGLLLLSPVDTLPTTQGE